MPQATRDISYIELIKRPAFFNQLIKSGSNQFLNRFLALVGSAEVIADIGCGPVSVIPNSYNRIEIDYSFQNRPSVVGSALTVPLRDLAVDHVCCSWTLEHVEDPEQCMLEFNRILKTGGYLYLTTNFVWHLHEQPRDFYRFTRYGLLHLIGTSGSWEVVMLEPTAGFWITLSQLMNYKFARLFKAFHPLVTLPLQLLGKFLEKIDFDASIAAGYCLLAQKKGSQG